MPAEKYVCRAADWNGFTLDSKDRRAVARIGGDVPQGFVYVAETARGKVVAWLAVRPVEDMAVVYAGAVGETARRRGAATALFAHVADLTGLPVAVVADPANKGLVAFAKAYGMERWRALDTGEVIYRMGG